MPSKNLRETLRRGKTLTAYLTLGDPLTSDKTIIEALTASGVDIFELGIPTTKPKYDGPVIRASHKRALEKGVTIDKAFMLAKEFTTITGANTILLTYFNVALNYGLQDFMEKASIAGISCVLFPDLLIDYINSLDVYIKLCEKYGVEPAFFITSCFPHRLVSKLTKIDPAFIYLGLMASTGILLPITTSKTIRIMKGLVGDTPLLAGFAISTPQQISNCIKAGADGVIIGSALLRLLEMEQGENGATKLKSFILSLKEALTGWQC